MQYFVELDHLGTLASLLLRIRCPPIQATMRICRLNFHLRFLFAVCLCLLPRYLAAETTEQACEADGACSDVSVPEKGEGEGEKSETNPFETFASWFDQGVRNIGDFFKEEIFTGANGDEEEQKEGDDPDKPMGMFDQIKEAFNDDKEGKKGGPNLFDLAELWSSTFSANSEESMKNLIDRAREFANDEPQTRTFQETFQLFADSFSTVKEALDRHFGHIDLGKLSPANLMYFLEHEDEVKNPSWKRRKHRFFKAVDPKEVYELHDALWLSEISYTDNVGQLEELLNTTKDQYELVYSKMESAPSEPAHYIAIKKQQKKWSNSVEVLMSIRGTKELGDLLSDAFLDAADYRGGKAHAGVMESGRHIAKKHTDLLRKLLDASGKNRISLVIVGHSLGAGAASIAAMEFNDLDFVDATAVGFGCPSLLSNDLAESTKDYILTIVTDSDVVPRMSGATVGNIILDIMGFDWTKRALRDVQQVVDVVRDNVPFDMPRENDESVLNFVNSTLNKMVRPHLKNIPTERLTPVLVPPGRCVHFFRDGISFSGVHTPCNFFNSIDITWTMIDDHLTDTGYHRALLSFIRSYRNDMNFRFHHEPIF